MSSKVFKAQRFAYCDVHVCYGTVFVTKLSVGILFVPIQPFRVYKQHLIW